MLALVPHYAPDPPLQRRLGCNRLAELVQRVEHRPAGRHLDFETSPADRLAPCARAFLEVGGEAPRASVEVCGILVDAIQLGAGEQPGLERLVEGRLAAIGDAEDRRDFTAPVRNGERREQGASRAIPTRCPTVGLGREPAGFARHLLGAGALRLPGDERRRVHGGQAGLHQARLPPGEDLAVPLRQRLGAGARLIRFELMGRPALLQDRQAGGCVGQREAQIGALVRGRHARLEGLDGLLRPRKRRSRDHVVADRAPGRLAGLPGLCQVVRRDRGPGLDLVDRERGGRNLLGRAPGAVLLPPDLRDQVGDVVARPLGLGRADDGERDQLLHLPLPGLQPCERRLQLRGGRIGGVAGLRHAAVHVRAQGLGGIERRSQRLSGAVLRHLGQLRLRPPPPLAERGPRLSDVALLGLQLATEPSELAQPRGDDPQRGRSVGVRTRVAAAHLDECRRGCVLRLQADQVAGRLGDGPFLDDQFVHGLRLCQRGRIRRHLVAALAQIGAELLGRGGFAHRRFRLPDQLLGRVLAEAAQLDSRRVRRERIERLLAAAGERGDPPHALEAAELLLHGVALAPRPLQDRERVVGCGPGVGPGLRPERVLLHEPRGLGELALSLRVGPARLRRGSPDRVRLGLQGLKFVGDGRQARARREQGAAQVVPRLDHRPAAGAERLLIQAEREAEGLPGLALEHASQESFVHRRVRLVEQRARGPLLAPACERAPGVLQHRPDPEQRVVEKEVVRRAGREPEEEVGHRGQRSRLPGLVRAVDDVQVGAASPELQLAALEAAIALERKPGEAHVRPSPSGASEARSRRSGAPPASRRRSPAGAARRPPFRPGWSRRPA